jgi:hypothetical protein
MGAQLLYPTFITYFVEIVAETAFYIIGRVVISMRLRRLRHYFKFDLWRLSITLKNIPY